MADIPGVSFSLFNQDPSLRTNPRDAEGGAVSPVQQAIRTLSYRPPRTVGAGSPIPGALLNAAGSQGLASMPSPGGFEELLRRLFGLSLPSPSAVGSVPAMGGGSAPNPHVGPGVDSGTGGALVGEPTRLEDVFPGQDIPHMGNFNPRYQGGMSMGPFKVE